MPFRPLVAFLAAASLAVATGARAQSAADGDAAFRTTTLAISAYGEVKAPPEKAVVTLGVQTVAPTAAQAMADNAARMSQVITALRRQGTDAKDIQTSGVNLSAQYNYQPNKPPQLTGYQASNQVTLAINDLTRLGPSLDAVTAAGANQIEGVSFGLKDPQALQNQARLKAVQALQAKAELYAGAAGYHVARLVQLSEGQAGARPMGPMMAGEVVVTAMRRDAPTPIEPGELTVRADVSGIYELAR